MTPGRRQGERALRPALAEWLLERTLPSGVRGRSIKGDLDQEHDELRARDPSHSHDMWYFWESIKLAARFGVRAITERRREQGVGLMKRLMHDLRYAWRRVGKNPGFALVAILTIAIGIGANVAIFSVVNAVVFRPLPYDDAGRLVAIWEHRLESGDDKNVANPGNVRDWRDRATSFESVAAASMPFPGVLESASGPVEVQAVAAETHFFEVLGLQPELGGHFTSEDGNQLLLTHAFWTQEYGADPGVIGRTTRLNGQTAIVVGILPDDFIVWGAAADLYFRNPIEGADRTNSGRWLQVIGRMNDGVTVEQARSEMLAIASQLEEVDPGFNGGWSVNVLSLKEEVVGDVRGLMMVLLGAVGLLLLIACANVANLLLARGTGRRQEMAVRTSMGASGGMLGRQLLVEAAVLAGIGALLGLLIANYGSQAIVGAMPVAFGLPRVESVSLDVPLLLFTAGATALTTILFGVLPAAQASRVAPAAVLSGEARGPGRRSGRMRNTLVVAEVAVSLVLLVGAMLMTRSFSKLMDVDSGLDPENVITARIILNGEKYSEPESRMQFHRELQERLEATPGVATAGSISWLPFNGVRAGTSYWPADRPQPKPEDQRAADILNVTGDYFDAMGITLMSGRVFDARDREESARVAVVNHTLAEANWPGEDAIGKQAVFTWRNDETVEIVGVIADVRADGLSGAVDEAIYMPMSQTPFFNFSNIVIRTATDPTAVVSQLRQHVRGIDPGRPISEVQVVEDLVSRSVARPRVSAFLMSTFAMVAALLAGVGLYGVLSYAVARRIREIGVRVALGAQPGNVVGLVARQGGKLVLGGLALGIVGALIMASFLESLLFGVAARDPISLIGAALFLAMVASLACIVPAIRAMRVAPARALSAD